MIRACISCALILSFDIRDGAGQAAAAIIFTDDFNAGASPLWGNEVGAWSTAGGVYNATAVTSTGLHTSSSLPFDLTDFTIELDVNDIEDGHLWLRSAHNPAATTVPGIPVPGRTGVVLVMAGSNGVDVGLYWHIVTAEATSGAYGSTGNLLLVGTDHHLRVEVSGNTYSAFVDGSLTPATTLITSEFASGQVALGDYATNNFHVYTQQITGDQTFDNVVLSNNSAVPEPSSLGLACLAIGVLGMRGVRRRLRSGGRQERCASGAD